MIKNKTIILPVTKKEVFDIMDFAIEIKGDKLTPKEVDKLNMKNKIGCAITSKATLDLLRSAGAVKVKSINGMRSNKYENPMLVIEKVKGGFTITGNDPYRQMITMPFTWGKGKPDYQEFKSACSIYKRRTGTTYSRNLYACTVEKKYGFDTMYNFYSAFFA